MLKNNWKNHFQIIIKKKNKHEQYAFIIQEQVSWLEDSSSIHPSIHLSFFVVKWMTLFSNSHHCIVLYIYFLNLVLVHFHIFFIEVKIFLQKPRQVDNKPTTKFGGLDFFK